MTSLIHRSVCSRVEYTKATCYTKLQYVIFAPTLLLSCIRMFNGIMIPSCVCAKRESSENSARNEWPLLNRQVPSNKWL